MTKKSRIWHAATGLIAMGLAVAGGVVPGDIGTTLMVCAVLVLVAAFAQAIDDLGRAYERIADIDEDAYRLAKLQMAHVESLLGLAAVTRDLERRVTAVENGAP